MSNRPRGAARIASVPIAIALAALVLSSACAPTLPATNQPVAESADEVARVIADRIDTLRGARGLPPAERSADLNAAARAALEPLRDDTRPDRLVATSAALDKGVASALIYARDPAAAEVPRDVVWLASLRYGMTVRPYARSSDGWAGYVVLLVVEEPRITSDGPVAPTFDTTAHQVSAPLLPFPAPR